jgi:uncharacterized membrane protein YhhN
MKPALYPLPLLIVTVLLLIRAGLLKNQRQIYVFKPVSTMLVIAVALLSLLEPEQNLTYTLFVTIGLFLSLGGDIALMFQEKKRAFMLGLIFFLFAQIVYIGVFALLGRFTGRDFIPIVLLTTSGIGFYILIRPRLGRMHVPVIAYMIVISVMVCLAASTLNSPVFQKNQALMIASGAVLFYISDVIFAANRFWKPWKYNRISLAFYYCGQLFIALAASYFVI